MVWKGSSDNDRKLNASNVRHVENMDRQTTAQICKANMDRNIEESPWYTMARIVIVLYI